MIPFRILFAALLTLLIIFYKMGVMFSNAKREVKVVVMCAIYAAAGYFWTESLFINPATALCKIVSTLVAAVSFVYGYFVNFYSTSELSEFVEQEQFNLNLIGKTGVVIGVNDKLQYVGTLDDSKASILIQCDALKIGDKFKVTKVENNSIFAEKI